MAARWARMLSQARSLVRTTVEVASRPSYRSFELPISVGPGIFCTVECPSLQPGTEFQYVEVSRSADGSRICGRIEGRGWVDLAHRGGSNGHQRPVWYIVRRDRLRTVRMLPPKGSKGGRSGKGNKHGKGRTGRKQ